MISLCAALLAISLPSIQTRHCVGTDQSELDLFFENGEFQRAIHRGITHQEMPVTAVIPRDRAWFAKRQLNGQMVDVVRTELPEGVSVEVWLMENPIVLYGLNGQTVGRQNFTCYPLRRQLRHDESSGGQILF